MRGVVVAEETGHPLSFSAVSVAGQAGEQLTSDAGVFVIANLAPGTVRLRVRHIGYTAREVSVAVTADQTTPIIIRLTHVAVRLDAMRVDAQRSCTQPGRPSASVDPLLAAVFDQVEQNGQQYALLARDYPFTSYAERRILNETPKGLIQLRVDTIGTTSNDAAWHYAPGEVVVRSRGVGMPPWSVVVPTIAILADSVFVANHCFWNAGVTDLAGARVIRVDMKAADAIHDPDLNGSLYLDSATFMIRRSVLALSRAPGHSINVDSMTIDTDFEELLPALPVIAAVTGRSHRDHRAGSANVVADIEQQHLFAMKFRGKLPPGVDTSNRVLLAPPVLTADHGRLLGVFDARSGDPVVAASVVDSAAHFKGTTSREGLVGLGKVPAGHIKLLIGKLGYAPMSVSVEISPADTAAVSVLLQPVGASAAGADTTTGAAMTPPAVLRVTVVRGDSGGPLSDALVSLLRDTQQTADVAAVDTAGHYTFAVHAEPGHIWSVSVRRQGFVPVVRDVDIAAGDTASIRVTLHATPPPPSSGHVEPSGPEAILESAPLPAALRRGEPVSARAEHGWPQ